MNQGITLTIDGEEVTVPSGTTILTAAKDLGADIPTICYHDSCTANGLCRLCVVEVDDARLLQPACLAEAREGMVVTTRSDRVERSRRTILEMLDSAVDLEEAPEIQAQILDYGVDRERFKNGNGRTAPVIDDTRCLCGTTLSACCAGAAFKSAQRMLNTHTPSISAVAASGPALTPFLSRVCLNLHASSVDRVWACAQLER